jgi:hypothetical protein
MLNWWVILVPGLLLNLALWYGAHSTGNRVLAVLYSLALALYIARRLWHGVPDGYLTITLTATCDPRVIYIAKGTEFHGSSGDVAVATRGCRVPRRRLWWARWRGHELPRQIVVPVRRVHEAEEA